MYYTANESPAPGLAISPVRWLYVVPMAATTTFGLLVLMFKLVYMEQVHIDATPAIPIPEVSWEPPPPIEVIRDKPEKPDEVQEPPATPKLREPDQIEVAQGIPSEGYKAPVPTAKIGFNFNAPVEHFIVTPRYPGRALAKGIEGFVELRFDVNETGATRNIQVVRAEPAGYFEDAAIAAAERWKFQPKTEDGKPVYYRGLSKLVTFEMQKS